MAELRVSRTLSLADFGVTGGSTTYSAASPALWDPVMAWIPNELFSRNGQASEYVAVVQGRIGNFQSLSFPMTVKVGLGTEPRGGPTIITPRPNSTLSIQIGAPLPGGANVGVPFQIVEKFTMSEDDDFWQMAVRIEAQQGSLVRLDGISVTFWSLDHLTPARYDYAEFSGGITLPRPTGTSGPSGQDPAWEVPLVQSPNPSWALGKWASFYCAKINPNNTNSTAPGIASTPAMIAQRQVAPNSDNDTWPGPILPRYDLRGMYRRAGSVFDTETFWMLGGCNVVEIDEPDRRLGVVGQDINNAAYCTHAAQFSVLLEDLGGEGFTSQGAGPGRSFEVYKDRFFQSDEEVDDSYRLTKAGEFNREGSFWAEVVYPPTFATGNPQTSDILDHDVLLSLEPRGADRRPVEERQAPLSIIRKRFEPVPDIRAGRMNEARGPVALELAGMSAGRTFPGTSSAYRSEDIIRCAGFTALWFRDFVDVAPDQVLTEEPGPFVQVLMNREGPPLADRVPFPIPPMNAATGRVFDPKVESTAVDETEISWPLSAIGTRIEWALEWTIDTKRHPDWLSAMEAFLLGPDFPFVRWRSPDASEERPFFVLPSSVAKDGPRNGIWHFRMSVFENRHTEVS